tara:strand:+ start:19827 stop:20501 length:675 start_codon:yes stop_codon:yes gene_type:complete
MKLAVVTGASRGVGNYLATKLLENNYKVINIARNKSEFTDYCFDLTNTDEIGVLVKEIIKTEGPPDLLINNAGIASMNHTLLMQNKKIEEIMKLNLIAPILLTKEFAKFMLKKESKILNISTVAVPLLLEGESVYASSKSGIETFTKIFGKEIQKFKLQVSCLGLTPIQTDLIRNVPKDKIEKIIEAQPENREFKLEDVWEFVIRFINSEEKNMNGSVNYLGGF